MGTRGRRPAAARLRRMRWALTLLYAATSAVSLVALVVIAASIDAKSGSRDLDSEIRGRAQALSRAIWMDKGTLHLEPLSEDELATASDVTAVLQRPEGAGAQARWLRPKGDGVLPAGSRLDELWETTVRDQGPVLATIGAPDGRRLRWATAPVWDTDEIGAVVLIAVDLAPQERGHTELVLWLAAGCVVLVLVSAVAGHVLSGKSIGPSIRTLDQQEQFLAEAAHELRTPLATLRLAVAGGDAVRLVDHLDRLVTGLLSRARIDTGSRPLELTPLRLDLLVEQVVEELPRRGAHVSVLTEPTVVRGDPDLLAQAVRNLVENALRHGVPAGEPTFVEVSVAAGKVSVRDHGPGIAERDRERIFGDRVTGGRGGIGVGLAIVRWVAELHGGRAYVASAPGEGAMVELALPRFIVRS
ncbi:sensor histidine kinase [Pseudosporangium ferrugineum]|uniref:sensor histidine kinase n=1 Tax=Pseudosporangium ferrugineum TaxID=439699 RepID=UPI001B80B707|nr:HAMP domain-containing sensor histidine kinase [Pseudosporangium ferrugineum]